VKTVSVANHVVDCFQDYELIQLLI